VSNATTTGVDQIVKTDFAAATKRQSIRRAEGERQQEFAENARFAGCLTEELNLAGCSEGRMSANFDVLDETVSPAQTTQPVGEGKTFISGIGLDDHPIQA
jgi:hypothetical protein